MDAGSFGNCKKAHYVICNCKTHDRTLIENFTTREWLMFYLFNGAFTLMKEGLRLGFQSCTEIGSRDLSLCNENMFCVIRV